MHICLICVEFFAWGKYGGFGRAARMIGRELVRQGVQVSALVPRRQGQPDLEMLDGIAVHGFTPKNVSAMRAMYQAVDADLFHSQEPSFGTWLAQHCHPKKKHVITFRDTRLRDDWLVEWSLPSLNRSQVLLNWLYEDNFLVRQAIHRADGLFTAAQLLIPRAQKKYNLEQAPEFLPTPVVLPPLTKKAGQPTVCYLSRWDRRKRPERFFELAKDFPDVHFIAAGSSRDKGYDRRLREQYGGIANLELIGFLDQFNAPDVSDLLGKSWILINTSAREGLPNTFIEACAHRCAILSSLNPDDFASRFGVHVQDDRYAEGLNRLLQDRFWERKAAEGYQFVSQVFASDPAIQQHIAMYQKILSKEKKKI